MDIMPDFDLIDREYAYDGELGALYSKAQTTDRSEEHTSELQSLPNLVCRLLL